MQTNELLQKNNKKTNYPVHHFKINCAICIL